mgnify:CR=1 FL=1
MNKLVNGQKVALTEEEISDFEKQQQAVLDKRPERDLFRLRDQRDQLLSQSDWRDLPSYPGSNQEAWRTYRQQLRDLPSTTDPSDPTWPTAPEND